jgi:cytochrome c peroxidase
MRYKQGIQWVCGASCVWIGVALTSAQGPAPLSPADLRAMAASRTGSLTDVDERVAADGAFKTPGLRNAELTAPYSA